MKWRSRVAMIIGISALAWRGRFRRYEIAESSMRPRLKAGDYVIARRRTGAPRRGEIVIFEHPTIPTLELVKRVVGLPGESIAIERGQLHVDGVALAELWADGPTLPPGTWQLRPNEVFVLGDNRAVSTDDGRTIGAIPADAVHWRVVARYWPLGSIGLIPPKA